MVDGRGNDIFVHCNVRDLSLGMLVVVKELGCRIADESLMWMYCMLEFGILKSMCGIIWSLVLLMMTRFRFVVILWEGFVSAVVIFVHVMVRR